VSASGYGAQKARRKLRSGAGEQCLHLCLERLRDLIPKFELQGKKLFKQAKEPLGFLNAVTIALEFRHERKLGVHAPLAVHQVLFGKLEPFAGYFPTKRIHGIDNRQRGAFEFLRAYRLRAGRTSLVLRLLQRLAQRLDMFAALS
jgi:fido (protein-threonine AMPylation protein)